MAWTEADIPDLSGRTAVVTGANGGLGLPDGARAGGRRCARRPRCPGSGEDGGGGGADPGAVSLGVAGGRAAGPRRSVGGVGRGVDDPGRARAGRSAGEQRRGDGDAAADDRRRVRDAVRRRPPGALGVHRAPAAGAAAGAGRAGGDGDEHGAAPGVPGTGPGRSAHAAELRGVGGVRAGEDGQLPLRAGAAAAVLPRRGRGRRA